MPMGTNIKMSLMPKGINKIIYNPGVSISTPEYVLMVLLFSSVGTDPIPVKIKQIDEKIKIPSGQH